MIDWSSEKRTLGWVLSELIFHKVAAIVNDVVAYFAVTSGFLLTAVN